MIWFVLAVVGIQNQCCRGDGEICKTFQVELFTALLECEPDKRVDDGVDAGGMVVSICNPSSCSGLNVFYCFYIVCRVWVPDSGV